MAKLVLQDISNIFTAAAAISANDAAIEAAIENTLSRDGTSPNEMNAVLDMNDHRIINLPAPVAGTDVVRVDDVADLVAGITQGPQGPPGPGVPAGGATGQVLTKASNSDYDATWNTPGTLEGALQKIDNLSDLTSVVDARENLGLSRMAEVEVTVSVLDHGAVGDGIFSTGLVNATNGSTLITAAASPFVSGDVGKVITVPGAGPAGADLTTTIASFVNAGAINLATPASTTGSITRELFYGTDNSAAFQAAYDAVGEQGSVIIPAGNYHLLTAVSQPSKRIRWIGQPGSRFNVQASANAFNGTVELLDYASARDAASFEYGGTNSQKGEAWKYLNWYIAPTGTPFSYQKNALQVYVLQGDPSSGLGNGDAGPNISRDGVAGDLRTYIRNGNMTGRAFGLNVIAGHQGTSEGMLSGIEVDIANGASNVPSFDDNTVDFPKSGIGVVSKGPNHVTMAYHFMEGGGKFYVGYYGTPESIVEHVDSRFIKLRGLYSVYRHGHVTVGKDHSDFTLNGVEIDPAGSVIATGATGVGTQVRLTTGTNVPAVEFYVSGSKQSYINDNGGSINVYSNGVGSTGMYVAHGASAWTTISDERLPYKKSARPLTVLDKLDNVSLYENEVDGRLELFTKAQELHKAFPHLVNEGSGPDDYVPTGMDDPNVWGVSYDRSGMVALQGVKELYEIIKKLEEKVEALQLKLDEKETGK